MNYLKEKGVPIPARRRRGILSEFLLSMECGESFEFPASDRTLVMGTANNLKRHKRFEFNYVVRSFGEQKCRLWRVSVDG